MVVANIGGMTHFLLEVSMLLTRQLTSCLVLISLTFVPAQPLWACMDHDMEAPYLETEDEEEPVQPEVDELEELEEEDEASLTTARLPFAAEQDAMPIEEITCMSDLDCPSAMLCELVACCEAEDCECPEATCQWASDGAQGRECVTSDDCGPGYTCQSDAPELCEEGTCPEDSVSWCEADQEVTSDSGLSDDSSRGCEGGPQQTLPIWIALSFLISALIRAPRLT